MSYTTAAPGVVNYTAQRAPTAVAPGGATPPAISAVAPGGVTPPVSTNLDAGTGVVATTPAPLPVMPSIFQPAFVELDEGASALNTLTASTADIGRIVQGIVDGALVSYQVRAGDDAEDAPTIIRPANFHAVSNAVVFHLC